MAHNTKQRAMEIYEAALRLVDAPVVDMLEGEEHRLELRRLADLLMAETGCVRETARKYIAKALRRKRHPSFEGEGSYQAAIAAGWTWGGRREGAGRKLVKPEDK